MSISQSPATNAVAFPQCLCASPNGFAPMHHQRYQDINERLFVAYILDTPKVFSRTSWKILMSHPSQFTRLPGCTDQDMVLAGLKLGTHVMFTQVEAQLLIDFKCLASVRNKGLDLTQNPIRKLVGGFCNDAARCRAINSTVYKAPSSHGHQRHYLKRSSTSTLCSKRSSWTALDGAAKTKVVQAVHIGKDTSSKGMA